MFLWHPTEWGDFSPVERNRPLTALNVGGYVTSAGIATNDFRQTVPVGKELAHAAEVAKQLGPRFASTKALRGALKGAIKDHMGLEAASAVSKVNIGLSLFSGVVDGFDNYQSDQKDHDTVGRAAKAVTDGALNAGLDIGIGAAAAVGAGALIAVGAPVIVAAAAALVVTAVVSDVVSNVLNNVFNNWFQARRDMIGPSSLGGPGRLGPGPPKLSRG